jgi:hypothetical protein
MTWADEILLRERMVECISPGCDEGGPHPLFAPGHVALAIAQGWRPTVTTTVAEGPLTARMHEGLARL